MNKIRHPRISYLILCLLPVAVLALTGTARSFAQDAAQVSNVMAPSGTGLPYQE